MALTRWNVVLGAWIAGCAAGYAVASAIPAPPALPALLLSASLVCLVASVRPQPAWLRTLALSAAVMAAGAGRGLLGLHAPGPSTVDGYLGRTAAQVKAARARGIPVTSVTETLTPATASFQEWQVAQLQALQAALHQATGR